MQYLWAIIWSFLLGLMISYVIPSMTGGVFVVELGLVLGIVFSVFTILITALMPQGENQEDPAH